MNNIENYKNRLNGRYEEVQQLTATAIRVCLEKIASCEVCEISKYVKRDRPELSAGEKVELIRTVQEICCPEETKAHRRSIIIRG